MMALLQCMQAFPGEQRLSGVLGALMQLRAVAKVSV